MAIRTMSRTTTTIQKTALFSKCLEKNTSWINCASQRDIWVYSNAEELQRKEEYTAYISMNTTVKSKTTIFFFHWLVMFLSLCVTGYREEMCSNMHGKQSKTNQKLNTPKSYSPVTLRYTQPCNTFLFLISWYLVCLCFKPDHFPAFFAHPWAISLILHKMNIVE